MLDANDKLEIHELLARAVFGLDHKDAEMIEVCFTEDARFILEIKGAEAISPFEGRNAIMKLMVDSMNGHQEDRRHVISNIFFENANHDSATVVSTLAVFRAKRGGIEVMTSGVYRDELRKTEDSWQIALRRLKLDVPF